MDIENAVEKVSEEFNKRMSDIVKVIEDERLRPKLFVDDLKDISICLSSYFPALRVKGIDEVDDIVYEKNNDQVTDDEIPNPFSFILLAMKCYPPYHKLFVLVVEDVDEMDFRSSLRVVHTTYLKLMYFVIDEMFDMIFHVGFYPSIALSSFIFKLVSSRNELKLTLAVKILSVAFDRFPEAVMADANREVLYSLMWLERLTRIPTAKIRAKRRLISFWSQQISVILGKADIFKTDRHADEMKIYIEKYHNKEKPHDVYFVHYLMRSTVITSSQTFLFDELYSFFMSANGEEEKLSRLKDFIFACPRVMPHEPMSLEDERNVMSLHTRCCQDVVDVFHKYMEEIMKSCTPTVAKELEEIERRHPYVIRPYLESICPCEEKIDNENGHNDEDDGQEEEEKEEMDEEEEEEEDGEVEKEVVRDYTITKFLIYDDLMMRLHVMSIVNTAILMASDFIGLNCEVEGHDSVLFRNANNPLVRTFRRLLALPSDRRRPVRWIGATAIRMCPFLLLPERLTHLMPDVQLLTKCEEEMDQGVEEELHFALNCFARDDLIDRLWDFW